MTDYIERGFNSLPSGNLLCFVIDETKIHLSPLEGIVYQERVIRSWIEVDYIENDELKHGIVLDFVRRGGGDAQKDFSKFTGVNSGSSMGNPSVAFVESIYSRWTPLTPGDHSIACGILGLVTPTERTAPDGVEFVFLTDIDIVASGVELLFDGIFPVVDGKATSITIPGIGDVLPITQYEMVDKVPSK